MSSENRRYSGYHGYNKETFKSSSQNSSQVFSPESMAEFQRNTLPEPVMNVDSLFKLADFLDIGKTDSSFPEITVIPDVLRNVGKFVNERKKMKYSHKEFEKKIKFLSDGVDKQYHVAMQKIQNETEIQLAQINGNVQQRLLSINRHYDLEMQKVVAQYKLKKEEIDLYYQNLEEQRKEQGRRFDKMIRIATIERKKANKAIREAEQVCDFFRQKIYNNTATYEEREHYMELLKFRITGISSMVDIIPQLAAKIK